MPSVSSILAHSFTMTGAELEALHLDGNRSARALLLIAYRELRRTFGKHREIPSRELVSLLSLALRADVRERTPRTTAA